MNVGNRQGRNSFDVLLGFANPVCYTFGLGRTSVRIQTLDLRLEDIEFDKHQAISMHGLELKGQREVKSF